MIASKKPQQNSLPIRGLRMGRKVAHDVLALVDRSQVRRDHYDFILRGDLVGDITKIRVPDLMDEELQKATLDLGSIIDGDEESRAKLGDEFAALVRQVENEYRDAESGEFGGCWLWLLDNTHELTRALLQCGRISVSSTGRYVASIAMIDSGKLSACSTNDDLDKWNFAICRDGDDARSTLRPAAKSPDKLEVRIIREQPTDGEMINARWEKHWQGGSQFTTTTPPLPIEV